MVGVAGFEPATPSSRTTGQAPSTANDQRFSSRLIAFVHGRLRSFFGEALAGGQVLPAPRSYNPDDGGHRFARIAALSCQGSPPTATAARQTVPAKSRRYGA